MKSEDGNRDRIVHIAWLPTAAGGKGTLRSNLNFSFFTFHFAFYPRGTSK
jgi:hypothetical protein